MFEIIITALLAFAAGFFFGALYNMRWQIEEAIRQGGIYLVMADRKAVEREGVSLSPHYDAADDIYQKMFHERGGL